MDSFEFNKIAMAVLGVIFIVMSLTFLSDSIFHSEAPEKQGYAVEAEESDGHAEEKTEKAEGPAYDPVGPLLASADLATGEKVAKKCAACHTFDEGGAKKVGPPLYNIVDRDIASSEGFSYSAPMTEYGAGKKWTYEELNGFLFKPKDYIKKTAMGFAGIKKTEDRAALIAYMRSLSGSPAPLPAE